MSSLIDRVSPEVREAYQKKVASQTLDAARRGSSGLPIPESYLPGMAGLSKMSGEKRLSAYRSAAKIPVGPVPIAVGKGLKRKTRKHKLKRRKTHRKH